MSVTPRGEAPDQSPNSICIVITSTKPTAGVAKSHLQRQGEQGVLQERFQESFWDYKEDGNIKAAEISI